MNASDGAMMGASRVNLSQETVSRLGINVMPSGAIVFPKVGGAIHTNKKRVLKSPAAIDTNTMAFIPSDSVRSTYAYYWFMARKLADYSYGAPVPQLSRTQLASEAFALPPLGDQDRIVAAIEEEFSRIDAARASIDRAAGRLAALRQSVRTAAVLGRLVAPEIQPAPAVASPSVLTRTTFHLKSEVPVGLPQLPPGWRWALMGRLAERITVGHVGPMKSRYVDSGVPFLRSQNVRADRFDPAGLKYIPTDFHAELTKSRIEPGDLLVVRSGDVGVACAVPAWLGEANCADLVIVQRPQGVSAEFAALYLNSVGRGWIARGTVGVALRHFNTQSVANMPIPVPPVSEQARIVAEAHRRLSLVDSLERQMASARDVALKSSVLAAAFSGRLAA